MTLLAIIVISRLILIHSESESESNSNSNVNNNNSEIDELSRDFYPNTRSSNRLRGNNPENTGLTSLYKLASIAYTDSLLQGENNSDKLELDKSKVLILKSELISVIKEPNSYKEAINSPYSLY